MSNTILPNQFQSLVLTLNEVLSFARPTDAVLRQVFREQTNMGMHDRRYIAETVYGILRHFESLVVFTQPHAAKRLALLYHMKVEGRSVKELEKLSTPEDGVWLREVKAQVLGPTLAMQTGLPDWVLERLVHKYTKDELLSLGRSMMKEAPLDIRVNTVLIERQALLDQLLKIGLQAELTPYSSLGIRIHGRPSLQQLTQFKKGFFEVQDEGSQLLGLLLGPKRRDMVIDFCAGAGGKTLLLASLMNNQGRVYAFDVSAKRLDQLKPRLKRSGLSNIMPVLIEHELDQRVKRLRHKADRVMVDAPCSGLGTLRRNPDLKYRQSSRGVDELVAKQRAILEAASQCVKPGGILMYATCSLLPEENEQQAHWFSEHHPEFLPQRVGMEKALNIEETPEMYLQCLPNHQGTDGFFAAVWQRQV